MRSIPPSIPSSQLTRTIAHDTIKHLMWRNLGRRGRTIALLRGGLLLVLMAFVIGLLAVQPTPWRIGLFTGTVLVVAAMIAGEIVWLKRNKLKPRLVPYMILPPLLLHTVVITITGGAESPFLVMFAIVGIFPAVVIGRVKPFLAMAAVPLSLLWILSVGAATRALPDLTPSFLVGGQAYGNPWYAYSQAGAYTVATLIGGAGILAIRTLLERTAHSAAAIRQELFDMMRERNRELLTLSGELAHELKNPLASIRGLSSLVERKLELGSKEREQMSVLVGEVRRMTNTLDEFLNFSRPVVGLSTRPVPPAPLLEEVTRIHEGLAEQRGITLSFEEREVSAAVCDPRKIKQVLVNLMHNAIDATPQGGEISTWVEPGPDGHVRFVIEDSGSGIDARVRSKLFDPGVTTKSDGSGLGLTIARAIAGQHGGTLTLDQRSSGGCRAVLQIPPTPPTHAPLQPDDETPSVVHDTSGDAAPRSDRGEA